MFPKKGQVTSPGMHNTAHVPLLYYRNSVLECIHRDTPHITHNNLIPIIIPLKTYIVCYIYQVYI